MQMAWRSASLLEYLMKNVPMAAMTEVIRLV